MLVLFCMRGCGCIERPAFPAPSDFPGRKVTHNSGASRRGIGKPYLSWRRHCEERSGETIHPYFAATWIASLSLSSGARSRDPLAPRNDDLIIGCLKIESGYGAADSRMPS